MTFVKSWLRNSRPILAPVRAATNPTPVAMITDSSTHPIIFNAVNTSEFICIAFMS